MTDPSRVDPEFERRLTFHRAIIQSGTRQVLLPGMIVFFSSWLVPMLLSPVFVSYEAWWWLLLLPVVLALGFWATWSLHYRLIEKWYRGAVVKATDVALFHDLGVEAKLFYRPESYLGRREAPLFAKLREEVLSLHSDSAKGDHFRRIQG